MLKIDKSKGEVGSRVEKKVYKIENKTGINKTVIGGRNYEAAKL